MKQLFKVSLFVLLILGVYSCAKKDAVENAIPQSVLDQIEYLGYGVEGIIATDGGYIVENDIFLTQKDLDNGVAEALQHLFIGDEEQYHTNNVVTGLPRTITVSASGTVPTSVSNAIDAAIGRYNAQNLQLTFARVASGGQINVKTVNGGNYIASAGFPSGGNPYPEIKFNNQYSGWAANTLTTIMAHEMGHCIGYRHTDWMNRAYSCGTGGSEGAGTVGANHIPGTPTGPESGSWMLACIGNNVNRPFTANDKTALNYLY